MYIACPPCREDRHTQAGHENGRTHNPPPTARRWHNRHQKGTNFNRVIGHPRPQTFNLAAANDRKLDTATTLNTQTIRSEVRHELEALMIGFSSTFRLIGCTCESTGKERRMSTCGKRRGAPNSGDRRHHLTSGDHARNIHNSTSQQHSCARPKLSRTHQNDDGAT